jgi:hypothetical protein
MSPPVSLFDPDLLIPISKHPWKFHVPADPIQRVLDVFEVRRCLVKLLFLLPALEV